ncbi:hypothetical protein LXL04_029527 [Taraxacum kok-saghyz]
MTNQETISNYTPKKGVIIDDGFIATPLLKVLGQQTSDKNFQNIIYQNNYSNEILSTVGGHLDRIEENFTQEKLSIQKYLTKIEAETTKNTKTLKIIESKLFKNNYKKDNSNTEENLNISSSISFVPHQIEENFNLGNKDLIDELEKRLSKLTIKNISTLQQTFTDESEDNNSEIDINTLAQQFTNEKDQEINTLNNQFSKLNKINQFNGNPKPTIRNYWPRPYLPDVQIEERAFQYDWSAYDGASVYEWNIDGYSEHQIINIVQEMTMAANAYKSKGNTQPQIINIIISGFTGTLKGWWDFYVTPDEKINILSATKTIVKQENGQHIQTKEDDMVNALVFALIKNFIGDPTMFQEKTSEILMNLHCIKLTDFRWYRENYLVKVFSRPDYKEAYWKERFIAGLPKLFAERIREKTEKRF